MKVRSRSPVFVWGALPPALRASPGIFPNREDGGLSAALRAAMPRQSKAH